MAKMLTAFNFVGAAVVVLLFVWFYHGLLPVLRLKIEVAEAVRGSGTLRVRLRIENVSRVVAKVKAARVAFVEHDNYRQKLLSDWVPFDEPAGHDKSGSRTKDEDRLANNGRLVRPVMRSTRLIKPGQVVEVELCYQPLEGSAVHCGFQVRLEHMLVQSLYPDLSFATTAWFLPEHDAATNSVQRSMVSTAVASAADPSLPGPAIRIDVESERQHPKPKDND